MENQTAWSGFRNLPRKLDISITGQTRIDKMRDMQEDEEEDEHKHG